MSRRPSVFQEGNFGAPLDFRLAAASNELNYRRERDDKELKAHQAALKKQQGQKIVDDIANLDHIGNSTVDITTDNNINGVRTTAQKMLDAGATDSEIRSYLSQTLPPVVNGHTVAQNYANQMKKEAIETAKVYGGDPEKLYQTAMQKAVPDWVEVGQDGNMRYKALIDPNKPYIGELAQNENLHLWHPGNGKLMENIQKSEREKVGETDKFDNKGNIIATGYKGENTKFVRPVTNKEGRVIGKEVIYDEVPNPFGGPKPLQVLPAKLQTELLSDPEANAGFQVRWTQEKQKSEQALGRRLKPDEEEGLKGSLLLQIVKDNDRSNYIPNDYQKIAKPPVTHISINNNGANGPTVRQQYAGIVGKVTDEKTPSIKIGGSYLGMPMNELDSDEAESIVNEVKKAKGLTDADINTDKWFLRYENGKLKVYAFDTNHPKPVTPEDAKKFEMPAALITISGEGVDMKAQARAKDKVEVINQYKDNKQPQVVNHKPTSNYVEVKEINGVKWGKTKDGKIEKVK